MNVIEYRCSGCDAKYASFAGMPDVCIVCRAPDIAVHTRQLTDFSYYMGDYEGRFYVVQAVGTHLMLIPHHFGLLKHIECAGACDIIDLEMWPGTIGYDAYASGAP
jgi:hypothetical protein